MKSLSKEVKSEIISIISSILNENDWINDINDFMDCCDELYDYLDENGFDIDDEVVYDFVENEVNKRIEE